MMKAQLEGSMVRISSFCVGFFFLFLSVTGVARAEDSSCVAQLAGGSFPVVRNAKLSQQTTRLCYSEIALLYSGVARAPLWSAEHLTAARVQSAKGLQRPRSNAFHAEIRLSSSERAELDDYRRSGYDRGHMAPNGDMSTPEAQAESFSLANMVPQDPCNNEVLWEGIESAVRDLTLSEGEVFVVTGPVFRGAELRILNGRVLIPTHLYKAIYVPSRNIAGAYFAPNDASQKWEPLTIAELEARVGIDVFPKLAANVKKAGMTLPKPTPHFGCRVHTTELIRNDSSAEQ
jgi:endonuclease G, mitochondrial